jgi:hypothetical protein
MASRARDSCGLVDDLTVAASAAVAVPPCALVRSPTHGAPTAHPAADACQGVVALRGGHSPRRRSHDLPPPCIWRPAANGDVASAVAQLMLPLWHRGFGLRAISAREADAARMSAAAQAQRIAAGGPASFHRWTGRCARTLLPRGDDDNGMWRRRRASFQCASCLTPCRRHSSALPPRRQP